MHVGLCFIRLYYSTWSTDELCIVQTVFIGISRMWLDQSADDEWMCAINSTGRSLKVKYLVQCFVFV